MQVTKVASARTNRPLAHAGLFLICAVMVLGSMQSSVLGQAPKGPGSASSRAANPPVWYASSIWRDTVEGKGVTIGDVDSTHPGNEIVADGFSFKAVEISQSNGEWVTKTMWESPGGLVTPAIGDFDPSHPGNEVVVVGYGIPEGTGEATMLENNNGVWKATPLFHDNNLVYGVAVGDFYPGHTGNEVAVDGWSHNLTMIYGSGTTWTATKIWTDIAQLRAVAVADIDPDHAGNELITVGDSNNVTEVYWNGAGWTNITLFHDPDSMGRLAIGDVDPAYPGNEIVVVDDGGNTYVIHRESNKEVGVKAWTDGYSMRGVAIGDVDPSSPGLEIAVTGYSGNVTILYKTSSGWAPKQVWSDIERLHAIAVGDVDSTHTGNEVVVYGYSMNVTVIGRYVPDFAIDVTPVSQELTSKDSAVYKISIGALQMFSSTLTFSISGLPLGVTSTFSKNPVVVNKVNTSISLTLAANSSVSNGDYPLAIKAMNDTITKVASITLSINRSIGMRIDPPANQTVKAQSTLNLQFNLKNTGNRADSYSLKGLSTRGWPVTLSMNSTTNLDLGSNITVVVTVTVPKNASGKVGEVKLLATSNFNSHISGQAGTTITVKKSPSGGICAGNVALSLFAVLGVTGTCAQGVRRRAHSKKKGEQR